MVPAAYSPAHVDYLQRAGLAPRDLNEKVVLTSAPPHLRRLWRVHGIGRIAKHADTNREPLKRVLSEDLLIGLSGHRIPIAFAIVSNAQGVGIEFGTWSPVERESASADVLDQRHDILRSVLSSLYPAVDLSSTTGQLLSLPMAGLVLGSPTAKSPDPMDGAGLIDRVVRAMTGTNWGALVLAEPVEESVTSDFRRSLLSEMRTVAAAAQAERAPSPLAEHYLELLKVAVKTWTAGISVGMWRTALYLLGDDRSYHQLASVWRGVFSGESSVPEPIRVWTLPGVARLATAWAMPDTACIEGPGGYHHPLEYQTLLTSAQLAAYVQFPEIETTGFSLTTVPAFDAVPPSIDHQPKLELGQVVIGTRLTDVPYEIKIRDLTRHTFVAGVTGAGKTTTIFQLLQRLDAANVPFLVIEPAKREYRALLRHEAIGARLRVYTLGDERVSPFRLNPFEVPVGTPVGVHLDLLRSVFATSFGMWTPLPQVLERCLLAIYEDRGWDIGANSNRRLADGNDRAAAFPTLQDLAEKVDELSSELGYEDRVRDDIRAALLTRINSLRSGGKGRMLDVQRSLPLGALLSNPAVMELEGMGDDDDKAFLMALLFIRLVEHRRATGATNDLTHVVVIEEAHRLLSSVGPRVSEEESNPRGKAVEAFAGLLSEIRAYGQGVIVADQIPVKLASDVIKNTNLKFAHRTVAADDRNVLAGAMAMDQGQASSLATLRRGQAAVFSEGDDAPVLVQVTQLKDKLSERVVDDNELEAIMRKVRRPEEDDAFFRPFVACQRVCGTGGPACDVARTIAETPVFQRALARMILSIQDDPSAVDRLWPDLRGIVLGQMPPTSDQSSLMTCLAVRASAWYANRRGTQGGWTYAETDDFGNRLLELLLAAATNKATSPARQAFQELAFRLHARTFSPFPACEEICRQERPLCLYRFAAADLLLTDDFDESWRAAESADAKSPGGRPEVWKVSMDAANQLIEFGEDDWPVDRLAGADAAGRRVSLCFAQQMLSRDPAKSPTLVRKIMTQIRQAANDL